MSPGHPARPSEAISRNPLSGATRIVRAQALWIRGASPGRVFGLLGSAVARRGEFVGVLCGDDQLTRRGDRGKRGLYRRENRFNRRETCADRRNRWTAPGTARCIQGTRRGNRGIRWKDRPIRRATDASVGATQASVAPTPRPSPSPPTVQLHIELSTATTRSRFRWPIRRHPLPRGWCRRSGCRWRSDGGRREILERT
jgi:hypothetical protein